MNLKEAFKVDQSINESPDLVDFVDETIGKVQSSLGVEVEARLRYLILPRPWWIPSSLWMKLVARVIRVDMIHKIHVKDKEENKG